MFKKLFLLLFFIFLSSNNLISKTLKINGLSKLNLDDLQSITSIDNITTNDINILLKELSLSELIYNLEFSENSDHFVLLISESDLIENIFINNNTWIEDELIIQNLRSKKNLFLTDNKIKNDIKIIKNIYKSKG